MKVTQEKDQPVEREVLATSITRISDSLTKLRKSGINMKGIVALIHDDTKLSKSVINLVLRSMDELKKNYCNV